MNNVAEEKADFEGLYFMFCFLSNLQSVKLGDGCFYHLGILVLYGSTNMLLFLLKTKLTVVNTKLKKNYYQLSCECT